MKLFVSERGQLRELRPKELECNGYFLGGFQNEADKGILCISYFDNGTCLSSVCDEQGNKIVRTEFAGKNVNETNFKI